MFEKIISSLFAMGILLSLVSCGTTSIPYPNPSQSSGTEAEQMLPIISGNMAAMQLDANADGSTQQLKVGEVMAITLESNPSTGYSWFVTSLDVNVAAQKGEARYTEPSTTPLPGAPGTETIYIQAVGAGSTIIILDYKRGWETNTAPESTLSINVVVK
jgi:inhibitor of cysteine peptidase